MIYRRQKFAFREPVLAKSAIGRAGPCYAACVFPLFFWRRWSVFDFAACNIDHELGELGGIAGTLAMGGIDSKHSSNINDPRQGPENCPYHSFSEAKGAGVSANTGSHPNLEGECQAAHNPVGP
jgi:hypothetical protein